MTINADDVFTYIFDDAERRGQVITAINALFPRLQNDQGEPLSDSDNAIRWVARWALSQLKEYNRVQILRQAEEDIGAINGGISDE